MCSMRVAFSSDGTRPLASLREGARATIVDLKSDRVGRADRLLALGVVPGASVQVLQTAPAFVFLCDQTELAVEHGVARTIYVRTVEGRS